MKCASNKNHVIRLDVGPVDQSEPTSYFGDAKSALSLNVIYLSELNFNSKMNQASINRLEDGCFHDILVSSTIQTLLGHNNRIPQVPLHGRENDWKSFLSSRVNRLLEEAHSSNLRNDLFLAGCAALQAFLQSNVTGPPLSWLPSTTIIPQKLRDDFESKADLTRQLLSSLSVDGETVYALTPNVELFCLAKCLLNHPAIIDEADPIHIRFRLRVNTWHQRLLSEIAASLESQIYEDLGILEQKIPLDDHQSRAEFLIERATIHIHHGFDCKARADIALAAQVRKFEFVLTGRLGKRTKFQDSEHSQLVVLAKSYDVGMDGNLDRNDTLEGLWNGESGTNIGQTQKPKDIELNDDTLLESIAFSREEPGRGLKLDEEMLPQALSLLDPADQPVLEPLDSIILLATASSITNTSPQDGLTREETLPYATRVLTGSSTNWQIYTQALLVRSRIEGYRSRTVERGLLQLQAIVDQVIAETSATKTFTNPVEANQGSPSAGTFLPEAKPSESAPAVDRLRYVHLLASPTRWKLESELADRWVSLGGLRSALAIYERLQMWAEVALCWAAQDREDEAQRIVRNQLYASKTTRAIPSTPTTEARYEDWTGEVSLEKDPLPHDAPRLLCILGDLENSPTAYERAWEVSNYRYARAQRSLGKYYFQNGDLRRADEAYSQSLRINPQNHSIWFALGCVRLQLEYWTGAVDAFARAVQIDDQDAESWSNLAAALVQLPTSDSSDSSNVYHQNGYRTEEDEVPMKLSRHDTEKHKREAFVALKRAANLKRESYRIWQNLIQVAIQLSPPPYTDIVIALNRLIDLLGPTQGEKCVDVPVVEGLVSHLIKTSPLSSEFEPPSNNNVEAEAQNNRSGYARMIIELVQKKITPLITSSRRLWLLTAKLSLYLQQPLATLSSYEKAWRVTTNQPGWDSGTAETEKLWKDVAEATSDLADAYESLGERARESGLSEGEPVAKDWRFKACSAIRGIVGRAKEGWEGSPELEMLRGKLDDLKAA